MNVFKGGAAKNPVEFDSSSIDQAQTHPIRFGTSRPERTPTVDSFAKAHAIRQSTRRWKSIMAFHICYAGCNRLWTGLLNKRSTSLGNG